MTKNLYAANKKIRQMRPYIKNSAHCEFFEEDNLLEIAIPAHQCIHDKNGGCIMCNFGTTEYQISYSNILIEVNNFLNKINKDYKTILLCTNGSFFDDRNIPHWFQINLMKRINNMFFQTIIFETHVETISNKVFEELRSIIPDKSIIIEVGLESTNALVQRNCYLKNISIKKLSRLINDAKGYNIQFQLNIILGAPFISKFDRFNDAKDAIIWALENDALVTLFPMNIKPFTLLRSLYDNNLYENVSHWEIPLLLKYFSDEELENIDLAWYGNREIDYNDSNNTIFPNDCECCHKKMQEFYKQYMSIHKGYQRKQLVNKILSEGEKVCNCLEKAKKGLIPNRHTIEEQIYYYHEISNQYINKSIL